MTTESMLPKLLSFNTWANRAAAASVATAASSHDALRALSHLLLAERTWLDRIDGDSSRTDFWEMSTLEECVRAVDENAQRFASTIASDALGRVVHYRNSKGLDFQTPVGEILTHVMMHSMYHRGQVAMGVRQAGGTPAVTDYIAYLREVPAASATVDA